MDNTSISRYKNGLGSAVSPKIPNPMITVTREYDRLQREDRLVFSAQHLLPLLEKDSWARLTTLLFPQGISVFFQFYTLQVVSNLLPVVHFIITIEGHIMVSALCQIWEYFLDFQKSHCSSATQRRQVLQREICQGTSPLNPVLPKGGDRAVKDRRAVKDSNMGYVRCSVTKWATFYPNSCGKLHLSMGCKAVKRSLVYTLSIVVGAEYLLDAIKRTIKKNQFTELQKRKH